MGALDDILKAAPADERVILEKHLKAFMAEVEADLAIFAQSAQSARDWTSWRKDNWDDAVGMTKAEKAVREELAAANAKLAFMTKVEKVLSEKLATTSSLTA